MNERAIPEWLAIVLLDLLRDVRSGKYNAGAQLTVNVSREGVVTSAEPKGRIEPGRS